MPETNGYRETPPSVSSLFPYPMETEIAPLSIEEDDPRRDQVSGLGRPGDVGMAECQDTSQLRVTYITNDRGPDEREREGMHGSVGGPMLRASHRLSSRRYPAPRLPYFNATVIGSPPATGIS